MQEDWNDFYPNDEKPTESNFYSNLTFDSNNKTLSPTAGNSYIFNCFFYDMKADSGAAIFSTQTRNLLIEKCTINSCTATKDTAGIRVLNGNCIIASVYSQYGNAGNNDGFCSVLSPSNNSVFTSSISHCKANSTLIMTHMNGHVNIKSTNLSHNKANSYSSLGCYPNKINEETGYGSNVIYCSFTNNTANVQICVFFNNYYNSNCTHEMKNCNVIANSAANTIWCRGNTMIISSCFLNNGDPCFYSYDSNSNITLFFSSADNLNNTSIRGLIFISAGSCHSSFNVIDFYPRYTCSYSEISLHSNLFLISLLYSFSS